MKGIIIQGDYTDAEFAQLVALIRELDARRPDASFQVTAYDPNASLEEIERKLREALPEQEGRKSVFKTFSRRPDA